MKLRILLAYDPLKSYNSNYYIFENYIHDYKIGEEICCDKIILEKLEKVFIDNKIHSKFFIDLSEEELFYLKLKYNCFEEFIRLCQI